MAVLVASLKQPRRILMMVPAGAAVDAVLEDLQPLLSSGDVVIDGGNTLYTALVEVISIGLCSGKASAADATSEAVTASTA